MTIAAGIELPDAEIAEICQRYRVRELSVFGSAARGEMRPDSDVDMLADYLPDAQPSLLDLIRMRNELTDLLGRSVDLGVKSALKPRYKDPILAEAQIVYAA
jgi:predicted nucleotidyltransferase